MSQSFAPLSDSQCGVVTSPCNHIRGTQRIAEPSAQKRQVREMRPSRISDRPSLPNAYPKVDERATSQEASPTRYSTI